MKKVSLRQIEVILSKAENILNNVRERRVSSLNRQPLPVELETASTLVKEMRRELSTLVDRISQQGDLVHGQVRNLRIFSSVNKAYGLLNNLQDDIYAIERDETAGQVAIERASAHLKQISSYCRTARDLLLTVPKATEIVQ